MNHIIQSNSVPTPSTRSLILYTNSLTQLLRLVQRAEHIWHSKHCLSFYLLTLPFVWRAVSLWYEFHPLQQICHAKMPQKWLQSALAMEKYHSIAESQEVLSRAGPTRSSAEVVNETYCVLLQWYSSATRLQNRQQTEVKLKDTCIFS